MLCITWDWVKKNQITVDKYSSKSIFSREGEGMKTQEAIGILMLSPCYWQMKISERRDLIKEFLASYAAAVTSSFMGPTGKKKEVN